jgi:flagellar motor switch protein FliG
MSAKKYNQSEKAAILLMAFGEDVASEIFKSFTTPEIKRIASAMQGLNRVDDDTIKTIMEEFQGQLDSVESAVSGGYQFTKNVLSKAFAGEDGASVAEQLGLSHPPILESLKYLEPKPLAAFLQKEHPQTIAVILAHMDAGEMGTTIKLLPEAMHGMLLMRLAKLESVDPEVLFEIEQTLQNLVQNQSSSYNVGGIDKVAKMLGELDSESSEKMLNDIEERDPEMAEELRQLMFGFDDLIKIDAQGIQLIIKSVGPNAITLALKGCKENVAQHFFSNMSERAAEMIRDDLEAMPKQRLSDVNEARRLVVEAARKLESEGQLQIRTSDEVYV